jgi:transposase
MNYLRDLIHRLRSGESERRIARDLVISRVTVHKYHQTAEQLGYLDPAVPLPEDAVLLAALGPAPQPPRVASTVEPHRETVLRLLDQGVEMTAIHARLRDDHGYRGGYSSVRRFVHQICPPEPEAIVRVHTAPGEEAQVDFGPVGPLYDPASGRLRPAYVFVATLSFSRHQYAELVFDQKIPTWIALHRRAFESWGGVPHRIVPDNLKAAVVQALVDDPVLGEAYRRMAQHYGFVISPTRPGTPQHKGKVENGIHYVQRNFLAGQDFADIHVANRRLTIWVREVAGTRRHGTTHQAPLHLFAQQEQVALLPLPAEPFTLCEVKPVKVHPDCHVTIAGSFYSVPYHYIGQTLDAYVGERVVQLFHGTALVATHPRAQQAGLWQTRLEHYPRDKAAYLERTPERCRQIAQRIGPATSKVTETLLAERPLDRLRSVQAILRLEETVGAERLEAACARAIHFGPVSHRRIKEILNAALDREALPDAPVAASQESFTFARSSAEFFAHGQVAQP